MNIADGYQNLLFIRFPPYVFHIQSHGPRKIGNGLLVRPILQNFAKLEHEHNGCRRVEVATQQRDGNRGSVQN